MHIVPEWIEALIFDLGGVVINIDFDQAFKIWARRSPLLFEDIRRRFVMDSEYEQHERGEINAAKYFNHLRKRLKLEGNDEEIAQGWNAIYSGEISQTLNDIRRVKSSVPCFAFTNSNPTHQALCATVYPHVISAFDKVFVSSELGLRKPEHAAFQAISKATGINLSAMLYFDDSLQNVEAALSAGLQAVHVRTPLDVKQALQAIAVI